MEAVNVYHIPALKDETMAGLSLQPDGTYVDVTFGGGGHSRAIMEHLGANGRLYGFDQDLDAYANRIDDPRFTFVHGNFRFIENFLRFYGEDSVDGILADLGVSFHHFDDSQRGFSFRYEDSPLDMRMSQTAETDAREIVNGYSEDDLSRILKLYGDLPSARRIARAIVAARTKAEIVTTGDLTAAVRPTINPRQEKKELSQVFQAFRMEVNHEVDALSEFLQHAVKMLRSGGRLAVITYHSIEDRMVKNFMRSGNIEGRIETDFYGRTNTHLRALGKPITPTSEEVERNPRSRSAKLRIAEKN